MVETKMLRSWPYMPEDLRALAERVDEILFTIAPDNDLPDGDWRWGVSVEVVLDDLVAGHVRPHGDGYLGFYPLEVSG